MRLSLSAKIYVALVSLLSLVVLVYFAPHVLQQWRDLDFVKAALIFSALAFLAQIYEVELVYKRMISTAVAVCLTTVLLGGAPLALVVTLMSTLAAEIMLRWGRLAEGLIAFICRISFNTGQLILSTFTAALIFSLLGGRPLLSLDLGKDSLIFYEHIIPAFGAFLAFALTNNALVSGIITLTQKISFTYHLRFNVRYLLVQILSLGILGILMAMVYVQSPWNLLLVLIPMGLVHVSFRNYMKLRYEAKKTFERVAEMLAARDPYTFEHSKEVADLAEKIAHQLGLPQDQIEKIKSAAMIHDLGKLGVPDEILHKPGPLSQEERALMEQHPNIGADLLKDLEIYADIVDIVRYEHERWDGSGYPKGLRGEEIPIGARIVATADIYNALINERPYRPAYSPEEALQMIREMKGRELDPQVVEALLRVMGASRVQPERIPSRRR